MKKYIQPATELQPIVLGAFVCELTSVTSSEQPQGSSQLAPKQKEVF